MLRLEHALPEPIGEPMNSSATTMTSARDTPLRSPVDAMHLHGKDRGAVADMAVSDLRLN